MKDSGREKMVQDAEQGTLFPLPKEDGMPRKTEGGEQSTGSPRVQSPQRQQVEFRACCWDDLLPDDHQARIVWNYVENLDLSVLYQRIKAVERAAGRPPIDPRILFALWLYATLRAVGSARELARRCHTKTGELPFQWICGGCDG